MTDYNSMKADEYAQRQGEMDEFDNAVDEMIDVVIEELPEWVFDHGPDSLQVKIRLEAKRRVMQAIKERSEPL